MRFEVDWQPTGPNVAAEERATVADLRIFIGDGNACDNEQPRRRGGNASTAADRNVRREDYATVSVYPLAEEIAFGWWRLFGARDARLRLAEGRAGYALPNVELAFDGTGFDAICRPITYENPEVSFTACKAERLARAAAESTLAGFVEQVLDRLAAGKVRGSALQLRWQRVQASRQDAEESAFCEAAGALGVDPYSIRSADAEFILNASAVFSEEPLAELLSGLRTLNKWPWLSGNDGVLGWLRTAEGRPSALSLLPAISDLRPRVADDRRDTANEMPWCAGYRCARAVRRQLNIGMGERFLVPTLAARLDGSRFETAGAVAGVRAVVAIRDDAPHVHLCKVASRYRQASELFALARAVGDVANPLAERSAVNDLHDAARQATTRAFAAEFLVPIEEVLSMREDGKNLDDIAEDFGVSKKVVEHQLQNRERIWEACAAQAA